MDDSEIKNKIKEAYDSAAFKGIMALRPSVKEGEPFNQNDYLEQLKKTASGLNDSLSKDIVGIFESINESQQ